MQRTQQQINFKCHRLGLHRRGGAGTGKDRGGMGASRKVFYVFHFWPRWALTGFAGLALDRFGFPRVLTHTFKGE